MSYQWTLIAGFLYAEVFFITILVLPILSPSRWYKVFNSRIVIKISEYSSFYFYILLSILALFLFDATREMKKYSNAASPNAANFANDMKNSIKLFRSQRNFYITFFAIFLTVVIRRLIKMINIQAVVMSKSEMIIEEAEKTKNLACKTIQDHDNLLNVEKQHRDAQLDVLRNALSDLEEKYKDEATKYITLKNQFDSLTSELQELKARYDIN